MKDLAELLEMDGIVIRKIPMTSVSNYNFTERTLGKNESIVEMCGRKYIREVKTNSLGGKYLITFKSDQGSNIYFSLKYDGIGDSPLEAYKDYCEKNG